MSFFGDFFSNPIQAVSDAVSSVGNGVVNVADRVIGDNAEQLASVGSTAAIAYAGGSAAGLTGADVVAGIKSAGETASALGKVYATASALSNHNSNAGIKSYGVGGALQTIYGGVVPPSTAADNVSKSSDSASASDNKTQAAQAVDSPLTRFASYATIASVLFLIFKGG